MIIAACVQNGQRHETTGWSVFEQSDLFDVLSSIAVGDAALADDIKPSFLCRARAVTGKGIGRVECPAGIRKTEYLHAHAR